MARPSRNVFRCVATLLVCLPGAIVACGGKKKAPAATDAAVAASDAGAAAVARDAAGPLAANELDVHRYDDETPIAGVEASIATPFANAYKAYPKGDLVTTIKQGDKVVEHAERDGFYRVTFDAPPGWGPEGSHLRLMGWMPRFVFEEATAAAMQGVDGGADGGARKRPPKCKEEIREFLVSQDLAARDAHCAYLCKNDLECKPSHCTCEAAVLLEPDGHIDKSAQYTTVCTDAGAPDTGPHRPEYYGILRTGEGQCPPLFSLAPKVGKLCYRHCKVDVDCPSPAKCLPQAPPNKPGEPKLCVK